MHLHFIYICTTLYLTSHNIILKSNPKRADVYNIILNTKTSGHATVYQVGSIYTHSEYLHALRSCKTVMSGGILNIYLYYTYYIGQSSLYVFIIIIIIIIYIYACTYIIHGEVYETRFADCVLASVDNRGGAH